MAPRQRKRRADQAPTSTPTLATLREELYALADPADAIHLQRFFKTAPGEYGAGDKFLGLRVPALRRLVREYSQLADAHALEMLASSWHEERLLALLLLVDRAARSFAGCGCVLCVSGLRTQQLSKVDLPPRDRLHGQEPASPAYLALIWK